ncbi:zinc-binding alcohol dehydrogenase family protein [Brevundimonas sp. LM2]|uniref:zinc-binding alcohol dehydrogenase family protein n=1 Tax=Brevundimonas sp. LM2 TaxID=1938605 RepID=UPI0012379722|nr:zinc-binding alcohol dehydrogenase family protein [Brevundimonas sp. LM2]
MSDNTALVMTSPRSPFSVAVVPHPHPGPDQVVVRARAVAVNPFDRLIQTAGDIMTPFLRYPAVVGIDVAGEVTAIGADVTRFQLGDRVVGFAAGTDKTRNQAGEGAFQTFVVLLEHMTSPIPPSLSFEDAAVLPLGLATAASALFQSDYLALHAPSARAEARGQTLLVWGGSTSVGTNAVQLAVAAGYDVIATASPHNFALMRTLGATAVFDYRDPGVVHDVVSALRGRTAAGAIAIGPGSASPCIDILGASQGNRFVAMATPAASFDQVRAGRGHRRSLVPAIVRMAAGSVSLALRARRNKVVAKMIWGSTLVSNAVGPMIFQDFLPSALAQGRYAAAPRAEIVGTGLAAIPTALERQRRGVSATKLVVRV